jgi:hypothetical protein
LNGRAWLVAQVFSVALVFSGCAIGFYAGTVSPGTSLDHAYVVWALAGIAALAWSVTLLSPAPAGTEDEPKEHAQYPEGQEGGLVAALALGGEERAEGEQRERDGEDALGVALEAEHARCVAAPRFNAEGRTLA